MYEPFSFEELEKMNPKIDKSRPSTSIPVGVYQIAYEKMTREVKRKSWRIVFQFRVIGIGGPITAGPRAATGTRADFDKNFQRKIEYVGDLHTVGELVGLWIDLVTDDCGQPVLRRHGTFTEEIKACPGDTIAEKMKSWARSFRWVQIYHPARISKIKKGSSSEEPPLEWFNIPK